MSPSAIAAPPRRTADLVLAVGVIFLLTLLFVPLPGAALDLFLATSIGAALVVLLVALQTKEPLEFSSFPQVLLLLTFFRIALNVASTRLILSNGDAGAVIEAFGSVVIGGNYAVGLVIFLLLVAVNFIVITKGAGRVAEVAARFALDAMPGKQMAVDAELAAHAIGEEEARHRRAAIAREADFFGAMDGATKYVKGDAIMALIAVGINILGGIFIGVVQHGMAVSDAAQRFVILTVGDGIATQVPALIISLAAGLMTTHASGGRRMGDVLEAQLGGNASALWIAAGVLGFFALVPGMPMLPFVALAGALAYAAHRVQRTQAAKAAADALGAVPTTEPTPAPDPMADLLQVEPLEFLVGYGVHPLLDPAQGGDLTERIAMIRKQAAHELGILIPQMRIRDDSRLQTNEYVIKVRGVEVARAEVMPRFLLALEAGPIERTIEGVPTVDPSFRTPGRWIAPSRKTDAEASGYVVVDAATMVATHIIETLKQHAADLLGRQDVQAMLDALSHTHAAVVKDTVPAKLTLGVLHRVLQRLLKERVPIRDLATILEAVGDAAEQVPAGQPKLPESLAEHARSALGAVIARQYMDKTGAVRGIQIGPQVEAMIVGLYSGRPSASPITPETLATLLQHLNTVTAQHAIDGKPVPLFTSAALRIGVRKFIEPVLPHVPVLSYAELPPHIPTTPVAVWELPDA